MNKIDLIGKKYGRLEVISQGETKCKPNGAKVIYWTCRCECGTQKDVMGEPLRDGRVKSCGCLRDETIGRLNFSHGKAKSKEYKSWLHIKYRCLNPNAAKYSDYGGRGITVCERWINSFENFYSDMGNAPSKKHTIDRIDVNGNYEPKNCRWADPTTQSNNHRNTVRLDFHGEQLTMSEIARKINMPYKYFWKLYKTNNLSLTEIENRANDVYKRSI